MKTLILAMLIVGEAVSLRAQSKELNVPGKSWLQYAVPEDVGFASTKLDSAHAVFERSGAAGVFVVYRGNVLASWGETDRKFICASVRKSFLSAMIGIASGEGRINLDKTLDDLEIDDIQKLSDAEKQATVRNLLVARSSVYHPAAYATRDMADSLPERGSKRPGEYWYYNNWDFNVLGTIFKQETGEDVFEFFEKRIATPLQMEDFQVADTYYRFELEKSKHPAYLFRMSARDMARFGVLYANNGKWNGKQIVPTNWVAESTQPVTKDTRGHSNLGSYGYLWWISNAIRGETMCFADGAGGQRISVFPKLDLVVVHVVNTYQNIEVNDQKIKALLGLLLDAKISVPKSATRLVPYEPLRREQLKSVAVDEKNVQAFHGTYHHRFLGKFEVRTEGDHLSMESGIGRFNLLAVGDGQYVPQDIDIPIAFKPAETREKKGKVDSILDSSRQITRLVFNY